MAHLYKHKSRGWQIRYLLYLKDGTQRIRYRYERTKEKALDLFPDAGRLETLAVKGELTSEDLTYFMRRRLITEAEAKEICGELPDVPTLEVLSEIVIARSKDTCRPAVHATNKGRIKIVLDKLGRDTRPGSMTKETCETYRTGRLADGVSPATVNKEMTKLSQILDEAVIKKAILKNPISEVKKLKDHRGRIPRSLTIDEIRRLLAACEKHPELLKGFAKAIMLTYLYTGMRRAELVYQKCEDIDLAGRHIRIQADVDPEGFITKSYKPRVIGLAKKLLPVVTPLVKKGGTFLFGGDKILEHPNSITRAFRVLADEAEFPASITLHSLRHTYITHLLEAGIQIIRVKDLAGHADIKTTMRYAHVLPSTSIAEDHLDFHSG